MLIKIKTDATVAGIALPPILRAARAAQSMKRQRMYADAARKVIRSDLGNARFFLRLWLMERTYWAHLLGLTDERHPATNARRV